MKRYSIVLAFVLCSAYAHAQILTVPLVTQEQNEWCWAGCSKCILNYYGYAINQCDIAEYARSQNSTFGTVACCVSTAYGCNNPNYNWGMAGSIQDILQHFDGVMNSGAGTFTTTTIASESHLNHLWVAHWAWTTGGGHFVVGHGISGSGSTASVYYMNPWPGEGLMIGTYSWMVSGVNDMGDHNWDATNQITSYRHTAGIEEATQIPAGAVVYPNPSTGNVWINGTAGNEVQVYSATGTQVYATKLTENRSEIDLSSLPRGMYILKIKSGAGYDIEKLVLQ
jgi:Secretion system C-terminal sorting domain